MVGLTAWQALVDTAGVGQGSRVLIDAAAGGIGHLAVQIAKARGAHVTALVSAANLDFVRSLGADEAIDYTATDFTETVRDQDIVLDIVGGDYPARALDVLKRGGILVSTQPSSLPPLAEKPRPSAASPLPASSSKQTRSACQPWPTWPPRASSFRPSAQPSLWRKLAPRQQWPTWPPATGASPWRKAAPPSPATMGQARLCSRWYERLVGGKGARRAPAPAAWPVE
jgi:NADPH:quinone reductase-like Zn-dependent oxidoreductase